MSKYRTFKGVEREIAKRLSGERVGHLGGADVVTPWLCVEVKSRQSLPTWVKAAVGQARMNAATSQLPVAVLHEVGSRYAGDLVVMTLADFQEWFGKA